MLTYECANECANAGKPGQSQGIAPTDCPCKYFVVALSFYALRTIAMPNLHDRNAKFIRSQCQIYTIAMPNLHDRNAYFARSQCLLCSIAMPTLLDLKAYFARSQFAHHQTQPGRVGKRLFVCPPKPIKLKRWAKQKDVLPTLPDYLTGSIKSLRNAQPQVKRLEAFRCIWGRGLLRFYPFACQCRCTKNTLPTLPGCHYASRNWGNELIQYQHL
jgi:hypothetical protein